MAATDKKQGKSVSKVVLHEDACPVCGTMMLEQTGGLSLPVNGEEIDVPDAGHLGCPNCGEIVLRRDHSRALRKKALARYRRKHRLLSGEEIRSVRERHRLSQAQLASLLRLGANTLSRWEADRNVQTAAMDMLLRLIKDVPGALDYLRQRAA